MAGKVKRKGSAAKSSSKAGARQSNAVRKPDFRQAREFPRQPNIEANSQPLIKGANAYKRSALGRGLSVLLSPAASLLQQEPVAARPVVEPAPSTPEVARPQKYEILQQSEAELASILGTSTSPAEPSLPTAAEATAVAQPTRGPNAELVEHGLVYVPIDRVSPSAMQPRKHFSEDELNSLANSIRESGLLQPLIVRRKKGENGPLAHYEIIAGERRWRAANRAGLDRVPVVLRQLSDREALGVAIVENVQRADLNPIEEAESYHRLVTEFGETQEGVAKVVGKDRVTVTNALRLLKLAPEVRELLSAGTLSAGHGRALLALQDLVAQCALAERVTRDGLSVRETEKLASSGKRFASAKKKTNTIAVDNQKPLSAVALEDRLRRALGTKVTVTLNDNERGEVRINFFSREELATLLERLNA